MIVCDQSINKYQYQPQLKEEEEEEGEEEVEEEKDEVEEVEEDKMEVEEDEDKDRLKEILGDAEEGKTLFIRNIPMDSTEKDLFRFFRKYGMIEYVKICKDK